MSCTKRLSKRNHIDNLIVSEMKTREHNRIARDKPAYEYAPGCGQWDIPPDPIVLLLAPRLVGWYWFEKTLDSQSHSTYHMNPPKLGQVHHSKKRSIFASCRWQLTPYDPVDDQFQTDLPNCQKESLLLPSRHFEARLEKDLLLVARLGHPYLRFLGTWYPPMSQLQHWRNHRNFESKSSVQGLESRHYWLGIFADYPWIFYSHRLPPLPLRWIGVGDSRVCFHRGYHSIVLQRKCVCVLRLGFCGNVVVLRTRVCFHHCNWLCLGHLSWKPRVCVATYSKWIATQAEEGKKRVEKSSCHLQVILSPEAYDFHP